MTSSISLGVMGLLYGLPGPGLSLGSCICLGIHPFPPDYTILWSIGFCSRI